MISLTQLLRGYDPEQDAVQSATRKSNLQRSTRPSTILSDTKAVDTSVTNWKVKEQTEHGTEWEPTRRNISPVHGRTQLLTEYDLAELAGSRKKKFEDKAAILKVYWTAGYTIPDTVEEINRSGYGKSLVASYFGCFTRAHVRRSKSVQVD